MKKNFVAFLLLFSLFFNIAHATVVALGDDCHHEVGHTHIEDFSASSDCPDLCEVHHCFHLMAIMLVPDISFSTDIYKVQTVHQTSLHPKNIHKRNTKPPIA